MDRALTTVAIRYEHDVVLARQRARQIAHLLGFDPHDQVRIATAVSELARNAFRYAKGGKADFLLGHNPPSMQIRVSDEGPGITNIQDVLSGRYVSTTGMGMGIMGARRLMDDFSIESSPKGTTVVIGKHLSRSSSITDAAVAKLTAELARYSPKDPFEEIQRQNQELLATLDELQRQKAELAQLNKELEDTNRGVVALYAELDERADYLRRASELKTQFLSNMTHEFRTPLNSILSLSRILLDGIDGPLTPEQEKQVRFIQRGANDLSELVNDLLDLAKVEAGKVTIRPSEFMVKDLFGALRGMLRPLLAHNSQINLTFEAAEDLPPLHMDESKISQILRNLISNALKFTEGGEVLVTAALDDSRERILFRVADTGIGIAPEDQDRIFEEFTQVEGPHQRGKRGTGLGLPLSRKLAELLGGNLSVESQVGQGSTFTLVVPVRFRGPQDAVLTTETPRRVDPTRHPILIVEDNQETLFIYQKYLQDTSFEPVPASTLHQAREVLANLRPAAVVLDIMLSHENAWSFLADFKQDPRTREIPALVVTMIENEAKARNLGADAFHCKPIERTWFLKELKRLTGVKPRQEALIIDDDEASRYVLNILLSREDLSVIEATGGKTGVELAKQHKPTFVFLDLRMPDLSGFKVLDALNADPSTRGIPVIVHTSKTLNAQDLRKLEGRTVAIIEKNHENHEETARKLRSALQMARAALLQP